VYADVQNPSTEPPPNSSSTYPPQITEEPFATDSAGIRSSPDSPVVDQHDESLHRFSTPPNAATLDYSVPEGRDVQLINSDEVPRYTKDFKM
jgi:hypothetical protein